MDNIINLQELNISAFIVGAFIIMSAIIAIYEIIGKFSVIIKKPVFWVKNKNKDHEILIDTVNKVNDLEKKDDAIKTDIDDILKLLKDHIETDKKNTRATFRSSLYRMHSDFTSRGFITKEGLKTFLECGAAYELADGDDIYHDKLKPEVMKLPIREVDTDGVLVEDI